jgi:acyl-CoA synthetase (AMP-forming)/AMP-acid ligase II
MPIYHSTATILGFLPVLCMGATIVIGHKFSNRTFWPEVRASKATIIQYVGETCRYLLTAPPSLNPITGENLDKKHNVRIAFGNGLRPDVWQKFKDRFGIETIAEFYSATEAVSANWNLSSNSFSTGAIGRTGALGRFLTRNKAAIIHLDFETDLPHRDPKTNFCTKVPPGNPGELLYVVDPADIEKAFPGYLNNQKANSSKIMRDVFAKGDAWFRTGDVVRLDTEGRLYFIDRIGDTYRWKSENVSTAEVSEVLGHHPAVADANVYGVELPNHDGRAGCVHILFNQEPTPELLRSLATHAQAKLARFAVPLFLRVTKTLVATGNNKQQKHHLRQDGVDPDKVGQADQLFWLRGDTYVPFGKKQWESLRSGNVKL